MYTDFQIKEDKKALVIFDGTFDGFLTVVYDYYYNRLRPSRIVEDTDYQQGIAEEVIRIETNTDKALRVVGGFHEKLNQEIYEIIYNAFLSSETERFLHILKYIILAFQVLGAVVRYEHLDYVLAVRKMSRYTGKEAHLLKGFTRFSETKDGIFYAEISPNNNVLPILAQHFAERLMNERWIIRDVKRGIAVIYNSNEWIIVPLGDVTAEFSVSEENYRRLWTSFHNAIGIEERFNPKLQRNLLPNRYRKHMVEFVYKEKNKNDSDNRRIAISSCEINKETPYETDRIQQAD